jgi:hypothetical protein
VTAAWRRRGVARRLPRLDVTRILGVKARMPGSMALVARGLALLWAAFWLLFFVVESWVWDTP